MPATTRKIWLFGYPGKMGGANTEAFHLLRLFRKFGVEVTATPTWGTDPESEATLAQHGIVTRHHHFEQLRSIPDLPGATLLGMCNSQFLRRDVYSVFKELGCKIIWINCMTFLFPEERLAFRDLGPPDAMIYHSQYQEEKLGPQMTVYGYPRVCGSIIRGAFETDDFPFHPREFRPYAEYTIGRCARPDPDKWSANLYPIYDRIQYPRKRGRVMGVNQSTAIHLRHRPEWIEALEPMALPVPEFWQSLDCCLTVNGGAAENWPRIGLECFATGVPLVTQDAWGWREMICHRQTGFLCPSEEELAHWAAHLAYDNDLRHHVIHKARRTLESELANPEILWEKWRAILDGLSG